MTRNTRFIVLYIAATFFLSWGLVGVFVLAGGQWATPRAYIVALVYMLIPGIVAALMEKYLMREPVRESLALWFRPNRWFLAAWFIPALLALAALGAGVLLPGVTYSPDLSGFFQRYANVASPEEIARMRNQMASFPVSPVWVTLASGLAAGITINAVFALGEELGWRGFLVRRLADTGFWKMSLIIGFVWGVWHAPIILMGHNYPRHPVAGAGMMIVFALLLTPILVYIRLKANSTVAAAIFHGTVNGLAGLSILVLAGGTELTVGMTGLAGFLVLAAANALLVAYDRFFAREPVMGKAHPPIPS